MKKKIFYVARGGLPVNALGIRIEQIGKILNKCGYEIHYICNGRNDYTLAKQYERVGNNDELYIENGDVHYKYNGNIYSYLPPINRTLKTSVLGIYELITAKNIYSRLKYYCEKEHPVAIILYNDAYELTHKMIPYCRKNNIKLMADSTEWPERGGPAEISNIINANLVNQRIKKLDKYIDGAISISKYFYNYYKSIGVKSIWIPPLMDVQNKVDKNYNEQIDDGIIRICYAGSPGNKDILLPFIDSVCKFNDNGTKIILDLIGIDNQYLIKKGYDINKLNGITAHGVIPHYEVIKFLEKTDFGILLRYDKRYAKAGFSTKLAECMSYGIPMICNRIGGSDHVIVSGENGYLIDSALEQDIYKVLNRVVSLKEEERLQLRYNAQKCAYRFFNPNNYIDDLNLFIKNL